MKHQLHIPFALALLVMSATSLPARTIDWGSAVGDTIVTSTGIPLDDTFIFELGTFGAFVPTEFNLDQWAANWKVFDRAIAPAANGWDSALGFVDSSATLQTNGTSSKSPPLPGFTFAQGEQAYIWAYNGLTIDSLTEWALITNNSLDGNALDDWTMPAHADQTAQPLDWRLSTAGSVPFGGLNDVEGPGSYTVDPGTFALQTHTVPEPGTALLIGLGGLAFQVRRRLRG
ncbi:MAG: PEP-CTERM sorting domain-containing protein [Verrucomicrobiaceae bacterium]|nr:PEP-CTERM sorting domain-containing protein [Verrucomicrobiaceae bacterium]